MPMNYVTMWAMLGLMTFGAVGGFLIHGDFIGSIRAAYPSDPVKREVLHRCGQMDAEFSRFSAPDREACYRAILPPPAQAAVKPDGRW